MSTSMYAIFNWGQTNNSRIETRPKRFSLALAGSEINIDDPPMNDGDRKMMCKKGESVVPYNIISCCAVGEEKKKISFLVLIRIFTLIL